MIAFFIHQMRLIQNLMRHGQIFAAVIFHFRQFFRNCTISSCSILAQYHYRLGALNACVLLKFSVMKT